MKILLGHLDWGLGNKSPHSDPADKTFLFWSSILSVKWRPKKKVKPFVKHEVKASVAGSCTILFI